MTNLEKISAAVSQFGMTASAGSPESTTVNVRNRKNEVVAIVIGSTVTQRFSGQKNLCGSLIVRAINAALRT